MEFSQIQNPTSTTTASPRLDRSANNMHLAQTLLALCTAASAVLGAPTSSPSKLETRQTTFNGKSLSILPLGDSITVRINRSRTQNIENNPKHSTASAPPPATPTAPPSSPA